MKKSHVMIGLTNPKSPSNVGAVMRAAGCYQVDNVFYTGQRYAKAAKFSTDTKSVSEHIPLAGIECLLDVLTHISTNSSKENSDNVPSKSLEQGAEISPLILPAINDGMKIICVDLIEGAIPLPAFEHPENAYYIFGPEDGTISQNIVDKADAVVYVPTVGCMNLAASVNVLLYDRLAKSDYMNIGGEDAGEALIVKSRDTNNTVKVKR
jgi:tRNA(Leu) C34 or U34 (ribose-2'-O)-methylase TrmL